MQASGVMAPGCNPMCTRLQPYAREAATLCAQASGVMASMTLLGSFVGFALFGFYLDVEHST